MCGSGDSVAVAAAAVVVSRDDAVCGLDSAGDDVSIFNGDEFLLDVAISAMDQIFGLGVSFSAWCDSSVLVSLSRRSVAAVVADVDVAAVTSNSASSSSSSSRSHFVTVSVGSVDSADDVIDDVISLDT